MNKFNMDYAEKMLNAYEGEHDTLPVTQDVVDEFFAKHSEELNTNRLAAEAFAPNIEVSPNPEVDIAIKNNGGKSFKGLRQYLIALYAGEEFTMSDGIKATMDNSDAKKISRANIWAKKETLGSFRKVIENAAFDNAVDYAEHPKYSKFRYYVATVKYGNILQPIWINVGLLKNGSAFHIYAVEDAKAEAHRRISDDRAGLTKRHQLSASAKDIIPHSAE